MKFKEKVANFVTNHKTALACIGTGIVCIGTGYTVGSISKDHEVFSKFQNGVEKATEIGVSAGIRTHLDYIRENMPEAYKQIKEFMKDNPDKYDIKRRLLLDDSLKAVGDSIGREMTFESFI